MLFSLFLTSSFAKPVQPESVVSTTTTLFNNYHIGDSIEAFNLIEPKRQHIYCLPAELNKIKGNICFPEKGGVINDDGWWTSLYVTDESIFKESTKLALNISSDPITDATTTFFNLMNIILLNDFEVIKQFQENDLSYSVLFYNKETQINLLISIQIEKTGRLVEIIIQQVQ